MASSKVNPVKALPHLISKLIYSSRKVNPFSGILFAIQSIRRKRISSLINSHLGSRAKQAFYSYGDVILGWCFCNLCGAERLEDLGKLKYYFQNVKSLKLPSPDSVGLILKSISTHLLEIKHNRSSDRQVNHQYSIHKVLNRLMLSVIVKLQLLNLSKRHTLDYDNVLIDTKKQDSRRHYKQCTGYQPGVAFIGRVPVYIEGRNGNSNAKHHMDRTLSRCFELLGEKKMRIKAFRSDAAAYQGEVIKLMKKQDVLFYIRANPSNDIYDPLKWDHPTWKPFLMSGRHYQALSMVYEMGRHKGIHRLVVYRYWSKDKHKYFSIITNDWEMPEEEVIWFYNQRGKIEQNFDILKNDFNWRRLPFSFLNENTVFMIISAITCIIYQYLIRYFSKKVDFVKRKFRLKNFIYHFVIVASVWENGALKLFTDRNYTPLIDDG